MNEEKFSFTQEEVADFFKEINIEALVNSLRMSIDSEKFTFSDTEEISYSFNDSDTMSYTSRKDNVFYDMGEVA
ncbi:MAG: hypothetical protein K2P14_07120 [Anaeroplasmataceae bacterium]|jgi:hypothetical protein|nr:hypothetical protein [Anaeroplasmataceae bacterium]